MPPVATAVQGAQPLEEGVVERESLVAEQVIGVDQQLHEAVIGGDPLALLGPAVDRFVVEDLPQGVVLDEGDRQLDQVVDEVGQDRTAAPGLRLERIGVGERAVVEAAELRHPVRVAVGGRGAEADGVPLLQVAMDLGQVGLEAGPVAEQLAVVEDAVEADLAARGTHGLERAGRYLVPLGAEVPAGDDPVPALHLEHTRDVGDPLGPLDVVADDRREVVAFGPVADEGDLRRTGLLELPAEKLALVVNEQRLDRPSGELALRTPRRMAPPHGDLQAPREQRLDPVVGAHQRGLTFLALGVAFEQDVVRIEVGVRRVGWHGRHRS